MTKKRCEATNPLLFRSLEVVVCVALSAGMGLLVWEDANTLRYMLGGYYLVAALAKLLLLCGLNMIAKPIYRCHDIVVAHIFFLFLHIFAAVQIVNVLQTWLLYHNALSADVVIDDILKYSRKSQEKAGGNDKEDEIERQLSELKKLVMQQDEVVKRLSGGSGGVGGVVLGGGVGSSASYQGGVGSVMLAQGGNPSTDALTSLVGISPTKQGSFVVAEGEKLPPLKNVHSMTSMDIWGGIGMGDENALRGSGSSMLSDIGRVGVEGGGEWGWGWGWRWRWGDGRGL